MKNKVGFLPDSAVINKVSTAIRIMIDMLNEHLIAVKMSQILSHSLLGAIIFMHFDQFCSLDIRLRCM